MGNQSKLEKLQAPLQKVQTAHKPQNGTIWIGVVTQLQKLLLQLQEFIFGISKNQERDSDAGMSSNIGYHPYRPEK